MRIKCSFNTKLLPVSYQFLFVSLIKKALNLANPEYFYQLYHYDNKQNKRSKNFTFYVNIDSYQLNDGVFNVDGKVNLIVSSPDNKFMIYLYNGLLKINDFTYKSYNLKTEKITKIPIKQINENHIICNFKSPLLLKNKEGKFIIYESNELEEELNYYADMNLKNYRNFGLKERIVIGNIDMKKVVIKEKHEKFIMKNSNNVLYINGSMGIIELIGDNNDLQVLYEMGLGTRRSQGFGCFDIL